MALLKLPAIVEANHSYCYILDIREPQPGTGSAIELIVVYTGRVVTGYDNTNHRHQRGELDLRRGSDVILDLDRLGLE